VFFGECHTLFEGIDRQAAKAALAHRLPVDVARCADLLAQAFQVRGTKNRGVVYTNVVVINHDCLSKNRGQEFFTLPPPFPR
jgi:hypothetical protein